jgi:hypothetical protein
VWPPQDVVSTARIATSGDSMTATMPGSAVWITARPNRVPVSEFDSGVNSGSRASTECPSISRRSDDGHRLAAWLLAPVEWEGESDDGVSVCVGTKG